MKLSFTTLGCPNWSFEKIISTAREIGYTGLEIRGIEGVMRTDELPMFSVANAAATKKLLAGNGLEIACFDTSVWFHHDPNFDAAVSEGKLAIDVCERMGAPTIRVFGDTIQNEEVREHVINQIVKGLRILCEYARGKRVDVLLEVHGDMNTVETITQIAEQIKDCPEFGLIWDVVHSDHTYGDNWREFYNAIKPYVRHTHIKDYNRKYGKYCLTGEGDVRIADLVKTLRGDGYDGWYSFEWEKRWHPELDEPEIAFPQYFKYMTEILK